MITTLLITAIISLFLYISFVYTFKRPEGCPPGPPRLPIFGSYLFLLLADGTYLHKGAVWLSKFYKSDIISLYIGDFLTYVVHSPGGVKEILSNSAFDGRPDIYAARIREPNQKRKGPPRIPIFGSYLFLLLADGTYLHKGAVWLSKFYKSDIISLYIGDFLTYVVHSPEGVKEILNNSAYDGRPDIYAARIREPNQKKKGIFFQDGPIWKEQRRFILRYLREYGFGRRFLELELFMNKEITELMDLIKNGPKYEFEKRIARKGQILCPLAFTGCTTSSILHVIFGESIPRSEQGGLIEMGSKGMQFQRNGDDYGKLLSIIPWIRHIFPEKSAYRPLMDANVFLYKFFDDLVMKYVKTHEENSERNFVDLYINEMRKEQLEGNVNTSYLYDQLVLGLLDFAFPAITALGTQLSLIFQWMLLKPEIVKRIQEEIDEYVGTGRLPCLDDRKNLHYTEATIREGLRVETLVPSDIPHLSMVDTEFQGYHCPKGTIMIPSLYAFHKDKTIWTDADDFKPERFLDSEGKLCLKSDKSLPFGAGKRLCAGETFARNMLFLIFSAICQNFNIVLAPGESLPDPSKNLSGIIISPPDYWLTLEAR